MRTNLAQHSRSAESLKSDSAIPVGLLLRPINPLPYMPCMSLPDEAKEAFFGGGLLQDPKEMRMSAIIEALVKGQNLSSAQAARAFTRLMEEELPASQAEALLLGLIPFPDKNCFNCHLEMECATGCRAEMRSISSSSPGPRSR